MTQPEATAFIGVLIGLVVLAGMLTIIPLVFRSITPMLIAAATAWVLLGWFLRGNYAVMSIEWIMSWVCIMAGLACMIEVVRHYATSRTPRETPRDESDVYWDDVQQVMKNARRKKRRSGYRRS